MVQLVNYVRSEVGKGVQTPRLAVDGIPVFDAPQYLIPTLEDDAVLYSLEGFLDIHDESQHPMGDQLASHRSQRSPSNPRMKGLEEELGQLQQHFSEYKQYVDTTLENRWHSRESDNRLSKALDMPDDSRDQDHGYFMSYSYNGKQDPT